MGNEVSFRGARGYLSNFYTCPIILCIGGKRLVFNNAEAAYQACKCPEYADKYIKLSGSQAKALGRKPPIRSDWTCIRVAVMYKIVTAKFCQNTHLMWKLKHEEGELVEYNTWGDTFWGVHKGVGENMLGRILMAVRDGLTWKEFEEKEFI